MFVDDIKIMTQKKNKIIKYIKKKFIVPLSIIEINPVSYYFKLKAE